jgi:uncharacterized protein involved in exopolysaccharide biosynthesis
MARENTKAADNRRDDDSGEPRQLTGRDIFKVLFRRKWVIGVLFLTTTIFVVWKASQIPTEYRATAKVLINRGQRKSALDRNVSLLTWDETVATELQIAESRPVIDAAQKILDDQAEQEGTEPIEIEAVNVLSRLLGESNVVGIEYMSLIESEVRPVADALAEAYIAYHRQLFALPDATAFFDDRVVVAEEKLNNLTLKRQNVQEQGKITRLEAQQDNLVAQIRSARDWMIRRESDYAEAEMEVIEAKRLLADDKVDIPFDVKSGGGGTGALQTLYQLKNRKLDLVRERANLLTQYTEQHPNVIAVNEQIAMLDDDLRQEVNETVHTMEANLSSKRAALDEMRRNIAKMMAELQRMPRIERELQDLDRSIKLANDAYAELLENQVRIQVAEVSSRDFTLSLLSRAGPSRATNPRDPVRLALVPAFSLLVGISLAFFIETMDHSLKSREDVERYIELPVLASVPNRKKSLTT